MGSIYAQGGHTGGSLASLMVVESHPLHCSSSWRARMALAGKGGGGVLLTLAARAGSQLGRKKNASCSGGCTKGAIFSGCGMGCDCVVAVNDGGTDVVGRGQGGGVLNTTAVPPRGFVIMGLVIQACHHGACYTPNCLTTCALLNKSLCFVPPTLNNMSSPLKWRLP